MRCTAVATETESSKSDYPCPLCGNDVYVTVRKYPAAGFVLAECNCGVGHGFDLMWRNGDVSGHGKQIL